ncbi:hypothetical protein VV11_018305, partial [Trichodesmium erythraeum 21-75]|nr:hypothetical protein [Trichodesmium erythraeum 21-75]
MSLRWVGAHRSFNYKVLQLGNLSEIWLGGGLSLHHKLLFWSNLTTINQLSLISYSCISICTRQWEVLGITIASFGL